MQSRLLIITTAVAALALPLAATAQPIEHGIARGAHEGGEAAGVPGAIVGGALGGAAGAVRGILGADERPRFHEYVVREHRPSYHWGEEVRVGAVLPEAGVTYYEVPSEYHVRDYRYAIINDRTVLVDPHSRRIVEVID